MKSPANATRTLLPALLFAACLAGGPAAALAASHEGAHAGHGKEQQTAGHEGMHSEHGGGKGMHGEHGGGKGMHGRKGMHGEHGGGKGMHGRKGMRGEHGGGMRHGGGKGMHGGHGGAGGHGGPQLYGPSWKETLTDGQKAQLDALHRDYARTKAPLKAGIKALKVALAALATAPEPDTQAIEAKIDELLALKRDAMRAKYAYVAAQRQVLSEEQRVSFDMHSIHRAMHGKKGGGHGGH